MTQFRSSQGTDPEVFLTAIVAVLMHYPIDVAELCADPYLGLPGQQPYTPTPYDVKQFCEKQLRPRREKADWDQRTRAQIEDRSQDLRHSPRQTIQEVEDEMAERGVFLPGYLKRAGQLQRGPQETPESVRRKSGLTQAQWDALPDDTHRGGTRYKPPTD